jgi:hypothetical protein
MAWSQLEPTPAHLTYLLLSGFLISYVLFVRFLRNRREYKRETLDHVLGAVADIQDAYKCT